MNASLSTTPSRLTHHKSLFFCDVRSSFAVYALLYHSVSVKNTTITKPGLDVRGHIHVSYRDLPVPTLRRFPKKHVPHDHGLPRWGEVYPGKRRAGTSGEPFKVPQGTPRHGASEPHLMHDLSLLPTALPGQWLRRRGVPTLSASQTNTLSQTVSSAIIPFMPIISPASGFIPSTPICTSAEEAQVGLG
jgi:hypothetical protein